MPSPEFQPRSFKPPLNIKDVLEDDLVLVQRGLGHSNREEHVTEGVARGNTYIYHVNGRPDLVVRNNPKQSYIQTVMVSSLYSFIERHEVNVLPYMPVEHNDETYVVTQKVEGINLEQAFKEVPTDIIAPKVDFTWKGLVDHLADSYKNGRPVAGDVTDPVQYMYGRVKGDQEDNVWLVDLGEHYVLHDPDDYIYEETLLTTAGHIVEMEQALDVGLVECRKAIDRAVVATAEKFSEARDQLHKDDKASILRATQYVLKNSVVISYEDKDIIDSL